MSNIETTTDPQEFSVVVTGCVVGAQFSNPELERVLADHVIITDSGWVIFKLENKIVAAYAPGSCRKVTPTAPPGKPISLMPND